MSLIILNQRPEIIGAGQAMLMFSAFEAMEFYPRKQEGRKLAGNLSNALANRLLSLFNRVVKSKRLLAVIMAGVLVAGAGVFYFHFWQSRPIGAGPAGPAINREAFSKPWTSREVWLIGLGDSVTAGFGARRGYSYFDRLVTNPPDEFEDMHGISLGVVLPNLHSTNLAVSGSTSLEHAEKQIPKLPVINSNALAVVVMTTGGNDLIHNYGRTPPRDQAMYGATFEEAKPWVAEFAQRMDTTIEAIKTHYLGGCEIFLSDIYDPTDGQGDIQGTGLPAWEDGMKIVAGYNEVIHQAVQRHSHVHLIPLHDLFLGHGIHCVQWWAKHYDSHDPHYWYYVNLEDPNERGYDAMRRLLLMEMEKSLRSVK